MELVTHKNKLQDLGALDKEALVIGGFFFYPHIFLSQECLVVIGLVMVVVRRTR